MTYLAASIDSLQSIASSTNGSCSAISVFITLVFCAIARKSAVCYNEALKRTPHSEGFGRIDFVVVGGGSAGSVLANRLTENPDWNVILLEAGGEQPNETVVPAFAYTLQGTHLNWNYTSEPQSGVCNNTRCEIPRGKVLGGSSVLNFMVYVRGNKQDYNDWADKYSNDGWSYEEVLPYFKKSENNADPDIAQDTKHHGTGGYLSVERLSFKDPNIEIIRKGLMEAGLQDNKDCNGESQLGVSHLQTTTLNAERHSTNTAFLEPVKDRPNLKILTRSQATKVLVDPRTKNAVGVEYLDVFNNTQTIWTTKEIILSAGTVGSPQILMLSGIGPEKHLKEKGVEVVHDLPGVGLNYHDHISAIGVLYKLGNTRNIPTAEEITRDGIDYENYPIRKGPLASVGPASTVAFIRSKYQNEKNERPDLQFHFVGGMTSKSASCCNQYGDKILCYYDEVVAFPVGIAPKSRGQILLNTTNPLDYPLIYQNLTAEYDDVKVVVEGMKFLANLTSTTAFQENNITLITDKISGCEQWHFGTDEYWECAIRTQTFTFYHPVGTCKMGPSSDKEAVVDAKLRVHGIDNLRVVDASAMPAVPSGNTNAPTIMLAEKAADMIKHDWIIKE